MKVGSKPNYGNVFKYFNWCARTHSAEPMKMFFYSFFGGVERLLQQKAKGKFMVIDLQQPIGQHFEHARVHMWYVSQEAIYLMRLDCYLFISASTLIYTWNKCVCSICSNQSHFKMMCFEEIYINTKMIPRISVLCIHIWIRRAHKTYFIILKFVVPGKEEDVNIKMECIRYRMLSRYNLCSVCINLLLLRSYYKMYENLISKLTRNEIQAW